MVLLALGCLAVVAAPAHGLGRAVAEPPAPERFYGVNAQFLAGGSEWGAEDPMPHLASIADGDLSMVRFAVPWHAAEPTAPEEGVHNYQWTGWDRVVERTASHGLELYAGVRYGTAWSSGDWGAGGWMKPPRPEYFDDFAAYAGALAERYGRGGSFWATRPALPYRPVRAYEIWNEPNWRGYARFEPEQYAELYLKTEAAIKAVDPGARVPFGALAYSRKATGAIEPEEWLRRAFEHRPELRERVDVVSVHLYGHYPQVALEALAGFRRWIDAHGSPEMAIDVSEDGVAVGAEHDWWRADYLAEMAQIVPRSGCGVSAYFAHTWWTPEGNPDDLEHWFGIAGADGTPKPSGAAYIESARLMSGLLADRAAPRDLVPICETGSDQPEPAPEPEPAPTPAPTPAAPVPGTETEAATPAVEPATARVRRLRSRNPRGARFLIDVDGDAEVRSRRYRLDRHKWRPSGRRLALRRLSPGRHVLRVKVRSDGGVTRDVIRWRVR